MPSLIENPDGTPHVHTYVRAKKPDLSPDPLRYRCDHPDCSHSEFKSNLLGKRSLCSKCRETEILLDSEMLKRSRPKCFKCQGGRKAQRIGGIANTLDEILKGNA